MLAPTDNAEAVEAWNSVLFDKFHRYRTLVAAGLAPHGDRAIDRLAPPAGAQIIDLGCGFGDTTLALAHRVGPTGRVVGVDAAPRFLDIARLEASGVPMVSYVAADLEATVPEGPYDLAYARFGTMFFAQPVLALRNVRRVLVPGGRLCMVVWRAKSANECFYAAEQAVRALLGDPDKGDQLTCGPGPFSMANADLVTEQLLAAGYTQVTLERSDAALRLGDDLDQAVELALELGPAGEVVRLAGEAARVRRCEIEATVRAALAGLVHADGVYGRSTAWIVTARNP